MNAQTSNLALIKPSIHISIWLKRGIERCSVIFDNQCQHIILHLCCQFDMTSDTFWIGVVDNICYPFLNGKIEGLKGSIVDVVFATDRVEEPSHTAYFCHLILHDDAPWSCRVVLLGGSMSQEE